MYQWVKQSWSIVREDIIIYFKKCGISNDLDGSEDHLMYAEDKDDNEEEEVQMTISGILKVNSIL